jgi:hypothetical protein
LGAIRFDELRAQGLSVAECKRRVAAEFNTAPRTVADWVQRKDGTE